MKEELLSVIDELKRLKKEGVEQVYVSEDSLRSIRSVAESESATVAKKEAEKAVASIPDKIRSASPEEFDRILKEDPAEAPAKRKPSSQFGKPPVVELPDGDKQTRWNALREQVLACSVCNENAREGYKVVFGVGDIDADIFFCGEAPGADEEEQGEPFVGKAGQLLTKMIQAMGLAREQVYIGNIMNWRPRLPSRVGNRPPTAEEMEFCLPYLRAQVEVVQPKLIVALGATASKGLLGADSFRSLREIKGRWHDFAGTPVLPTYHPSYLLRNDSKRDKRSAWEDLLKAMERCELPISERQRNFFL
jgi:uracil-DNA glycosylase family 4